MFRDKCDICHTFKVCRGYKDMIVCDECRRKLDDTKPITVQTEEKPDKH